MCHAPSSDWSATNLRAACSNGRRSLTKPDSTAVNNEAANWTSANRLSLNPGSPLFSSQRFGFETQTVVSDSAMAGMFIPLRTAAYKARAASPLLWQEKHPLSFDQAGTSFVRKDKAFDSAVSCLTSSNRWPLAARTAKAAKAASIKNRFVLNPGISLSISPPNALNRQARTKINLDRTNLAFHAVSLTGLIWSIQLRSGIS